MTLPTPILELLQELETRLELSPVDARRAAFVMLALGSNWSKARIGRYLGISRARVHQREVKYRAYAEDAKAFPQIAKAMKRDGRRKKPDPERGDTGISFKPHDWQDVDFAEGMIARVA